MLLMQVLVEILELKQVMLVIVYQVAKEKVVL
jgi:hypothetical protein